MHHWKSQSSLFRVCVGPEILCRLRSKIRAPYQALRSHVSKLERLQQVSEILRRTSRFVVLTRRLELQLAEMDTADVAEESTASESKLKKTSEDTKDTSNVAVDAEDEKERTIAKAALTIAELS